MKTLLERLEQAEREYKEAMEKVLDAVEKAQIELEKIKNG